MLFNRKRQSALEAEVVRLRGCIERLEERIDGLARVQSQERETRASLSQTLNEWVYGKESADGE